ncbi:MAG TPA: response regulator transcription factor [Terriglobales bacterium]|nr:response regulator transcription factor [Terriglobales bacterium]
MEGNYSKRAEEIRQCLKTILIVDDSRTVRSSLRTSLEQRTDWKICGEAENGREGIDQALRLRPDLILLDLSMPVMNGFEAARELQRLLPKVPILMFTTFCDAHVERQALAVGVAAVKSKSESLESLCGSIQDLFEAS